MKKNGSNLMALFLLIFSAITPTNQCVAGTTPPNLLSIDMIPGNIDVSFNSADITIQVHLTDNLSGVASWSTTLYSPSGLESITIEGLPGLVSGSITDGIFEAVGTLPQGSEDGAWTGNLVTVTDNAGNTDNIDLSSHGLFIIQVGTNLEDVTIPDVLSVEVSPESINVTNEEQEVIVTAQILDDLSGADFAYVRFQSPSGDRYSTAYLYPTSGTKLNATFTGTAYFPQYTESGIWKPVCHDYSVTPYSEYSCMHVEDRVGNNGEIDLDEKGIVLEVEVISPPEDTTPPDVIDAYLSSDILDVTDQDRQVTVTANIADNLSGADFAYLTFRSPSGNRWTNAYLYPSSGTTLNAILVGEANFPQYTEPGVWKPVCQDYSVYPVREYPCIHVEDSVGNNGVIDLEEKGINLNVEVLSPLEDTILPEVETIAINPLILDISDSDATIDVTAQISDDLSGANFAYLRFQSPSGNRYSTAYLYPTSGTKLDATFTGTAHFPQFTEPGIWKPKCFDYSVDPPREYSCMYVQDNVGNEGDIDLLASGIPLKLGVLSVPLDILFILEPISETPSVGMQYTLVSKISRGGIPVNSAKVTFEILSGPHQGLSSSTFSNPEGLSNFSFTGNTSGYDTIIASVDLENDGEIDAAKQVSVEWVAIDICGDLNNDGLVDTNDYNIFLSSFGRCEGQEHYNPACDQDGDKCITFIDYQMWYGCYINQ